MAQPILIAGAGIGGLAAAVALARVGFSCHVIERAPQIDEIGAGLQLGPNAFRAFDKLDLSHEIDDISFKPAAIRLMDSVEGRELSRQTLGARFEARFRNPYCVAYRADVQRTLLAAVHRMSTSIVVTLGDGVAAVDQDGDGVSVTLGSGRRLQGQALVGADGLRSLIRAEVLGAQPPRYAGHVAYRAVLPVEQVPAPLLTDDVQVWIGPGHHLVCYKLRAGQLFNIIAVIRSLRQTDGWDTVGDPAELDAGFAGDCATVRRLAALVHHGRMWALCDRDPAPGWTRGRITLLGDAAHPMLPYVAQGACMAIEDAIALADELAASADVTTAFTRYEHTRYPRTASVQSLARETGEVNHLDGASRAARNAALAARAPDDYDGVAWLFGGDGPKPAQAAGSGISIFGRHVDGEAAMAETIGADTRVSNDQT